MHEFSIVQHIVEIAVESARTNGAERIHAVEVEVGQASGVVKEAMEFAWEAAGKGTLLEGATLVITTVPLRVACRNCRTAYQPADLFDVCPCCGKVSPEIVTGNELRVVAIEV